MLSTPSQSQDAIMEQFASMCSSERERPRNGCLTQVMLTTVTTVFVPSKGARKIENAEQPKRFASCTLIISCSIIIHLYIFIYISHSPIQRPEGSWRSTRGMRFPKSSILSSLLFQVLLHHQCPQAYRLPMNSNHWFWLAKAPIDETVQACQTSIGTCSTSCDATTSWCGWYFTARAQKLRGGCHRLVSLQDDMGNWKPLGYAHVSGMLIS